MPLDKGKGIHNNYKAEFMTSYHLLTYMLQQQQHQIFLWETA